MARRARTGSDPSASRARARSGGSLVWLQGLLCGGLVALAPALALLLAVLLAPALGMLAMDRAPGRPVARTMLLFGASAAVFPAIALWNAGHTVDEALAAAFDPRTIAPAWIAAAGGWLVAELAPVIARLVLDSAALARRRRLRSSRDRCAEDWGLSPSPDAGR